MTKDQQYRLIFENWKTYTGRNLKESQDGVSPSGGENMDSLSADLSSFIKLNKKNTNKQQIIDFIKSNFKIFGVLNKDNQKKINSLLNSKIPDQPSVSDLPTKDIEILAKDLTNSIFKAYSSEHYTDISYDTKDSLKKKGEKFVPHATAGEMADVAKIAAAYGLAKVAAKGAEGAFTRGSILKSIGSTLKNVFTGRTVVSIASAIKNNPGGVALSLVRKGIGLGLLGAAGAGAYYLYKGVTDKEQKDLTAAEKKELEELQKDPKYKEFLDKVKELEAKRKKGRKTSVHKKAKKFGHPDQVDVGFDKLPDLKGEVTTIGNIQHNLKGTRKEFADQLLKLLPSIGIETPLMQMAIISAIGKESDYRPISEGAKYPFARVKRNKKNDHVPNRFHKRFEEQGLPPPTDEQIRAVSGGGANGVALFNIAYGYQNYQLDERLTKQTHPLLVNGKINPDLYDIKLAGWKYRGRGAIGVTFKETYKSSARKAGLDFKEIEKRIMELDEKNRGSSGQDPLPSDLAIQLNLGYLKSTNRIYNKIYGDPQSIEDAVEIAIRMIGGNWSSGHLLKHYNRSIGYLKRNFRFSEEGQKYMYAASVPTGGEPEPVSESKSATIKITKGGNNNA